MSSSCFSLEGKVALVTGGSRGIGHALALGLAQAGADVVVASRKLPDLEKVADEIRSLKRRSLAVAAHVGRMEDIAQLVETVKTEFGRIDILINNAGKGGAAATVLEAEERLWDSVMNLNLKGLFFLSQGVARVMRKHGGGNIINIASAAAYSPEPGGGIYAISKLAVIGATRVMAQELAQYNVRVNSVAPGYVHTGMTDAYLAEFPEWAEKVMEMTPMGRIAQPDEMVGAIVYLASDASSYVTGHTIIVDGGSLKGI